MFYLNYDLARHITDQRRAEAMARSQAAAAKTKRRSRPRAASQEADVVELVFAAPCEQERIGA